MTVIDEQHRLQSLLEEMLGDKVQSVSVDPQLAQPTPGKVAIVIEPPELEYTTWVGPPTIRWTLDVVAGTPATQASSLDLIADAIDTLAAKGLNIATASPATFSLAGAGNLLAYQVRLNPLDLS